MQYASQQNKTVYLPLNARSMIYAIIDNPAYGAKELGIAIWCAIKEKFSREEVYDRFGDVEEVVDLLIRDRVIIKDENDLLQFVAQRRRGRTLTAEEAVIQEFLDLWKKQTGTSPGLAMTKKMLQKHDDWHTAIHNLKPGLERNIAFRKWLMANNEFCPSWANLQTWLNQRRWEREYDPNMLISKDQFDEAIWRIYCHHVESLESLPYHLTQPQFSEWHLMTGPFSGVLSKFPRPAYIRIFAQCHKDLEIAPDKVKAAGGLYRYIIQQLK